MGKPKTYLADKTTDDIFGKGPATGMTLRDFKTYTGQQADWFVKIEPVRPEREEPLKLRFHPENIIEGIRREMNKEGKPFSP